MIHDLDKVSNLLVLACLYKPFSEVALNRHMKHLFLFHGQAGSLNFLLDLEEFFCPQLHHLDKLGRTQEQVGFSKLPGKCHLCEFESWNKCECLARNSHEERSAKVAQPLLLQLGVSLAQASFP